MSETLSIFFDRFKGIRTKNPITNISDGEMSAFNMENVELNFSKKGDAVGIYSMLGNASLSEIAGKKIIKMWQSVQNGKTYLIAYAVDDIKGYLYNVDTSTYNFEILYESLSKSDVANGITVAQGFYDYFFFTNGIDTPIAVRIEANPKCTVINATDYEGRQIRGLGLESYDGRLVLTSKNRVHWSKQGDIFNWSDLSGNLTDSAYQELDRDIKAIIYFNNSLIAFTSDYSVSYLGNPADAVNFKKSGATGGGCSSFNSVVRIDNKLFYYDHLARNLFSYYLYDNGQIRPSNGFADEVQIFFNELDEQRINELAIIPLIFKDKNEIWFKIPTKDGKCHLLILDYLKGEWLKRNGDDFNHAIIFNNEVISIRKNKILKEYIKETFDGIFKPSIYEFNILNIGSDVSKKIMKGSIYLTLDAAFHNDFYVELMFDDNIEKTKIKRISKKFGENAMFFTDEDADISYGYFVDDDLDLSGKEMIDESSYDVIAKISGITPFRQLKLRFFTKEAPQTFAIKRIEFSKIKVKKAK
ncbi:MAG: hypothetical protein BWY78_00677 [Alphaproteobacteria bacterium ADurb.Bin438]|nr:MAG: hypothetical protein BWY78_00677 [Alphaproteobacteria bacterium ADurb.Bin438]